MMVVCAFVFSPWHSSSTVGSAHLAYRKRWFWRIYKRQEFNGQSLNQDINEKNVVKDKNYGTILK